MWWPELGRVVVGTVVALVVGTPPVLAQTYDLGRPPTADETRMWDITIGPDGEGLPPGSGTAAEGRVVFARQCAVCHGRTGTEGPDDRLAGGQGTLASDRPLKTVGSYWPVATTLWDYINRAMPFNQPGSLSPDEVYASVAYVLHLNDLIDEQERLDATTLPRIELPNRAGFVPDPRPDTEPPSNP